MDKQLILKKYKDPEEKLLISKLFDKIMLVNKTNKIETTDFLNEHEQATLKNVLNLINFENYKIDGGRKISERKIIIIFPEKMKYIFENNNFKYDTLLSVLRVKLIKEDYKIFNHSRYLGGLLKLGINRCKLGDIIVYESGADIIIKKELEKFLITNIKSLNRFSNAEITNIKLSEIKNIQVNFLHIKIITTSLRLDNIVAELAKTSRSKALEILNQQRVYVNYENEIKATKMLKEKDLVTIRGKGKFLIDEIIGNTRKGNFIINIEKYN